MTKLLYLEDHALLESAAVIVSVTEENGKAVIILDQTVFYPQGGGQPYDTGIITDANTEGATGGSSVFKVEEVRFVDGIVKHIGAFEAVTGTFAVGQKVTCHVDKERRDLNCRLHSAGHVLDIALHKIGINWVPGKGFHFPQGPYVEYVGSVDGMDAEAIEKLRAALENKCNEIVSEGAEVTLRFMPKEEMHTVCSFVPEYIPAGKPARVVMYGAIGIPCGGTHVANLKDIKGITIRKIKKEKDAIRISYELKN